MKAPSERTLASWRASITKNGVARVKLRTFLRHFGIKRRGKHVAREITSWLGDQGIYVRGLDASSLDHPVELSDVEMTQIGALLRSETELQRRFPKEIMPLLGLRDPKPEYCPHHTRDKLDFLCKDTQGRSVAVELKAADGQRRGVEQLMRYMGQLKKEGGHRSPRGILITGYADPPTRRALEGRERDQHIDWYVYAVLDGKIEIEQINVPRC